jgi:magnesium-transporting ATPase (P-type)
MPIMAYAGFERDLDAQLLMKFPKLYLPGQQSLLFNWNKFFLWFSGGIFHSVLVYFVTLNGLGYYNNINNAQGYVSDNWTFGVNTYQNVVLLVTVVICLFTRSWTVMHALSIFLSLAAWFLFVSVYSVTQFNKFNFDYQSPVYNIFTLAAGTFPTYWLSLGLCCGFGLLPFYIHRWIEAHSLFGYKVRTRFSMQLAGNCVTFCFSRSRSMWCVLVSETVSFASPPMAASSTCLNHKSVLRNVSRTPPSPGAKGQ